MKQKKVLTLKELSNAEIRVEMLNFKNKYEAIQSKMKQLLSEMNELDKKYIEYNNELTKRGRL